MKKYIQLTCLALALGLVLFGCKTKASDIVLKIGHEISYGDETLTAYQLIVSGKYDNASIISYDPFIAGEQSIQLEITTGSKKEIYTTVIKVVDHELPTFTKEVTEINLNQNDPFNISDYFTAVDRFDGELPVELDYPIDTSTAGSNSRKVLVKARNGNVVEKLIVINIKPIEVVNHMSPNESSSNQSSNQSVNPTPTPPPTNPSNKQFMFVDGYDFDTGMTACAAYISQFNAQSSCTPIKKNGVYTGYLASFN